MKGDNARVPVRVEALAVGGAGGRGPQGGKGQHVVDPATVAGECVVEVGLQELWGHVGAVLRPQHVFPAVAARPVVVPCLLRPPQPRVAVGTLDLRAQGVHGDGLDCPRAGRRHDGDVTTWAHLGHRPLQLFKPLQQVFEASFGTTFHTAPPWAVLLFELHLHRHPLLWREPDRTPPCSRPEATVPRRRLLHRHDDHRSTLAQHGRADPVAAVKDGGSQRCDVCGVDAGLRREPTPFVFHPQAYSGGAMLGCLWWARLRCTRHVVHQMEGLGTNPSRSPHRGPVWRLLRLAWGRTIGAGEFFWRRCWWRWWRRRRRGRAWALACRRHVLVLGVAVGHVPMVPLGGTFLHNTTVLLWGPAGTLWWHGRDSGVRD